MIPPSPGIRKRVKDIDRKDGEFYFSISALFQFWASRSIINSECCPWISTTYEAHLSEKINRLYTCKLFNSRARHEGKHMADEPYGPDFSKPIISKGNEGSARNRACIRTHSQSTVINIEQIVIMFYLNVPKIYNNSHIHFYECLRKWVEILVLN